MTGLVMTAGGALGAYQAGVLKRIGELRVLRGRRSPFPIVVGASAGAINGALIAAGSDDFAGASRHLARIWSRLRVPDVFRTDVRALGRTVFDWARDLALGGVLGGGRASALLDASPLRALFEQQLNLDRLPALIERGDLYALAVSATSYHSGRAFTFIHGKAGHALWQKSHRVCLPVTMTVDHICASASIPLVFAPVKIPSMRGEIYFGDGGLRLVTPFHPAIRLGARRVLAVGVRCSEAAAQLERHELDALPVHTRIVRPPLSQICGVFLNAIFLDHLDADLDHLERLNELIRAHGSPARRGDLSAAGQQLELMRTVDPLIISPSHDLALVAEQFAHRMPIVIRYALEGLGPPDAQSADLMSYLLFDSAYTSSLVDIGYADAHARIEEIEEFVCGREADAERERQGEHRAGLPMARL